MMNPRHRPLTPALLLLGVLVAACSTTPPGRVLRVPAEPSLGYASAYYLYVPDRVTNHTLLVIPNNSGFVSDDLSQHDAESLRTLRRFGTQLAERLHSVLLVPVFPRSQAQSGMYTHALDRDTLLQSPSLDQQLIAMIHDAQDRKLSPGTVTDERVFLFGFSASGMFVNRFALIHPERVRAVACGSPGGWPVAPVATFQGTELTYPVGISDLATLIHAPVDLAAWSALPLFFFLGEDDDNDSVPYDDGYDPAQSEVVFHLFGSTLVERFSWAERLSSQVGSRATFRVYPHVGHRFTPAMRDDVVTFFEEHRLVLN